MTERSIFIADESLQREIAAADEMRITALLSKDRSALEAILADDLIYVHSSGRSETKDVYIDRIVQGFYDYRLFAVTRRELHMLGGAVLDNGDSEIDIVVNGDGKLRQIASRYLMVWKSEDGRWKLSRFHACSIERSIGNGAA